jgi:hypothetical protein
MHMNEMAIVPRVDQTASPIAERIDVATVPGVLRRVVVVPEDAQGIWLSPGGADLVPAGKYAVGGLFPRLLGRPRPTAIVLVPGDAITLQPRVGGLMSAEGELLEASFDLVVEIDSPATFVRANLEKRIGLSTAQLEGAIAGRLASRLSGATREFRAVDLKGLPAARQAVGEILRAALFDSLGAFGLKAIRVSEVVISTAAERVELMRRLAEFQQQMQDAEFKAHIKGIQSEKEWNDFLAQMEHEYHLRDLMRQDELEELRTAWSSAGGDPDAVEDHLEQAIIERIDQLEERLTERVEQLATRVGSGAPSTEHTPLASMVRIVNLLRTVAGLSLALLTLFNLYGWFTDQNVHQALVSLLGVIVAALAIISSVWYDGKVTERRREAMISHLRLGRMSRGRRQEIERLVREQVQVDLRKAASNLKDCLAKSYLPGHQGKDAGLAIRELSRKIEVFQNEVDRAEYANSPYFSRPVIHDEELRQMLNYDEGLLSSTQLFADRTQTLYGHLLEGQLDEATELCKALDKELLSLRNRFADRAGFMQNLF